MERSCKASAEAPSSPLLQDQYWCYVAGAHRDMAPEEFQEFIGALGPPPQLLQFQDAPTPPLRPTAPPEASQHQPTLQHPQQHQEPPGGLAARHQDPQGGEADASPMHLPRHPPSLQERQGAAEGVKALRL